MAENERGADEEVLEPGDDAHGLFGYLNPNAIAGQYEERLRHIDVSLLAKFLFRGQRVRAI